MLTRDGTTEVVRVSIDGTEAFSFVDTSDFAVFSATDQIIRFFQDDTATSQTEAEGGFVDRIRLFDAAMELNDQRGATFNRVVGSAIDIGAYESQGIPVGFPDGDYNHDGIADAADYTVWLDTLGSTTDLRADGSGNNIVDQADYDFWKANFGNTTVIVSGNASGTGVGAVASAAAVEELVEERSVVPRAAEAARPIVFFSDGLSAENGVRGVDAALTRRASTVRIADDDLLLLALGVAKEASDSSEFAVIDEALAEGDEEEFTLGRPEEVLQAI